MRLYRCRCGAMLTLDELESHPSGGRHSYADAIDTPTFTLADAIARIQKLADDSEREQLVWYVGRLMHRDDAEELPIEELRRLHEYDDWLHWSGTDSEDIEVWEN